MPVSRRRRKRSPAPRTPDPWGFPDTSLSPYTEEGRIQVFGNVLRAAKYGDGHRRRAGQVLLGFTIAGLLMALAITVVVQLL